MVALTAGVVIATTALPTTALAARRDKAPPTAPTSLAVTGTTSTTVSLSWQPAKDNRGVAGYGLYRNGARVAATTSTAAAFGGLTCGEMYTFGVDAYDAAGNRSPIQAVSASGSGCADMLAPTVPAKVAQSGATTTSISLAWTPSSDDVGVVGYGLYRAGLLVATSVSASATFGGLSCGSTYTLGVDGYDAAGNRSPVTTVSASTSGCPDTSSPTTPVNLGQMAASSTSISIVWGPSLDDVGVAGYGLYRNGSLVGSTAGWNYTFVGFACGTTYTLAVDAYDWAGNRSPKSSIVASTSPCADTEAPSAPTGLSPGEVTVSSVALAWSASSDNVAVAGYGVYADGARVASSGATSFVVSGLACGTGHTFEVDAFDAAGNKSPRVALDVATRSCGASGTAYPIRGMYDRDFSATGYDDISALGFNFIDSGASRDFSELAARGLKGFVWLGGYDNTTCTFRETDSWVRDHVQAIAGNPGVGAYFIDDEPNAVLCPSAPGQMKARSDLVKSIDPGPPTLLVDYKIDQLKLWAGTVDVIGLDKYPCKIKLNGCDYSIIDQQAAEADRLGIRYWGVIQAWGDDYYKLPTPAELHAQFERWRGTNMEGYLVFAWRYPEDTPSLWLANHPELQDQLAVENGVATTSPPPPPLLSPPPPPPEASGFPQGLWAEVDNMTDAELVQAKGLGYDFVWSNATITELDRAQAAGLKAAVWLGKWFDDNDTDGPRCSWQKTDAQITSLVNAVKGHPAVAYWFLDDEPHDLCANVRQQFLDRNALVKSLDPRPTFISENRTEAFDSLANVTDILVAISYPCNFGDATSCSTSNIPGRISALEAAGVQTYWAMRQVFNEKGSDAYYRYPTASQYASQSSQWDNSRVSGELGFMSYRVYSGADGVELAPQELKDAVAARNAR